MPKYIPETWVRNPVLEEGKMDIRKLEALRPALEKFCGRFDDCVKTAPSRRHVRTYLAGQLGPLPRKSVEPIALEAGVPPRSLQEFLEIHRWDHEAAARRVRQLVMERHADPSAIGVIDESSFAKKGEKTVGIQRQHCGETGKTDNCVVTVHLGYATDTFHALVDGDVYLPEKTWALDAERRREAGVPEELKYRPKWRIAVDLVKRSVADGMRFKYLTADEDYGRCAEFRRETANLGLLYVVEVPRSLTGWTPHGQAQGREPERVEDLWRHGGPTWGTYHVKDTETGPVVWKARASRFRLKSDGPDADERWLLVARNVVTDEVKFFVSNAPADAPVETMLHVAFTRPHVEQLFQEAKGEIGMRHFEVRRYVPVMRHLVLSMASLLFLNEQVEKFGGKKGVVEHLPDPRRRRGATRSGRAA